MFFLALSACNVINPDEQVPTIIHVEPFAMQIEPGQGSGNIRIPETWVYANGNNLGAFAPPFDLHYLEEGSTEVVLRPGIRNNGIANDAIIYPMLEGYALHIDAVPGERTEVHPTTRYKSNAVFSLLADFEVSNDFVENRDTFPASMFIRSQQDVFEGDWAGQMIVTKEGKYAEVTHSIAMGELPFTAQRPTYLELRYKNEVPFYVGIIGLDLSGNKYSKFFYLAYPTDEWNMVYLDLTGYILESALPAYKIVFSAVYPVDGTASQYNCFVDNIKVVHL